MPNWPWPWPATGVFHGILLVSETGPTGFFSVSSAQEVKPKPETRASKQERKRCVSWPEHKRSSAACKPAELRKEINFDQFEAGLARITRSPGWMRTPVARLSKSISAMVWVGSIEEGVTLPIMRPSRSTSKVGLRSESGVRTGTDDEEAPVLIHGGDDGFHRVAADAGAALDHALGEAVQFRTVGGQRFFRSRRRGFRVPRAWLAWPSCRPRSVGFSPAGCRESRHHRGLEDFVDFFQGFVEFGELLVLDLQVVFRVWRRRWSGRCRWT